MNQRKILALVTFSVPLVVVAVACTFPDVTFSPSSNDSGPGSDSPSNNLDAPLSTTDANTFDGAVPDVALRDSTIITDPSVCASKPTCDCDGDGYRAADCGADAAHYDASLKPGDCDDLDVERHPEAGLRADIPKGHEGDWNCDGFVDHTPPQNLTCTGSGLGCGGGTGFLTAPKCGEEGDLYECPAPGLLVNCTPGPSGRKTTQLCQ